MKLTSKITNENAQSALNLTAEILNKTGPRLTGTESCQQAGELLKFNLDKFCHETFSEKVLFLNSMWVIRMVSFVMVYQHTNVKTVYHNTLQLKCQKMF